MKKYYSFVWCVAFTLFLFGTLLTNAQNTSESEFLREITENELQITTEQRTRFENVKRNPIYKQVKAVKIGNIKALQNRSRLLADIPLHTNWHIFSGVGIIRTG